MPKLRREAQLGILFALTLFLFIWGLNYLRGYNVFQRQITFHTVYDEVAGLLESNPVTISGVNVGQIDRIAFHPDGSGKVVVTSIVGRQINIPANSIAFLGSPSLIGGKEIMIQLGTDTRMLSSGDTLRGMISYSLVDEFSNHLLPMAEKAGNMIVQMDSVLTALQLLLNQENREMISQSIEHLNAGLASLASTSQTADELISRESDRLSGIMSSASSILENVESQNQALNDIISNMSVISDSLAESELKEAINNAGRSLQEFANLMEQLNAGEGSAGLLMQDETLFRNLEAVSLQLDLLLQDIRENPGKYFRISVFGR